MSSAQRAFAVPKTNPTVVFTPTTLSYATTAPISDSQNNIPVPFTVDNQVLDIAEYENVVADLLTPGTYVDDFTSQPDVQCSIMGGLETVTSLGPNMITFLKNFINAQYGTVTDDQTSDISIHIAPTMTRIRYNYMQDDSTYRFTDFAPVQPGQQLVSQYASTTNRYCTVAVFRSPLVVKFNYNGNIRYLTFTSALDSN
jgi:hypothetical protein